MKQSQVLLQLTFERVCTSKEVLKHFVRITVESISIEKSL